MLRSDLRGYSDAYIFVRGFITVTEPENTKRNKSVTFKNNAPFINCISKTIGVQIDNAEDLDVVMPMYSLLEYSKNYRKTGRNQVIPFLLILSLLNTIRVLQEILIILVLVMLVMMQTNSVKMKLKLLFH